MEPDTFDLKFLIFFACAGTVLFIGACIVMWRYYEVDLFLRRHAPKLAAFLAVIARWLERVLSKLAPKDVG
jgi:hypothetical protein